MSSRFWLLCRSRREDQLQVILKVGFHCFKAILVLFKHLRPCTPTTTLCHRGYSPDPVSPLWKAIVLRVQNPPTKVVSQFLKVPFHNMYSWLVPSSIFSFGPFRCRLHVLIESSFGLKCFDCLDGILSLCGSPPKCGNKSTQMCISMHEIAIPTIYIYIYVHMLYTLFRWAIIKWINVYQNVETYIYIYTLWILM